MKDDAQLWYYWAFTTMKCRTTNFNRNEKTAAAITVMCVCALYDWKGFELKPKLNNIINCPLIYFFVRLRLPLLSQYNDISITLSLHNFRLTRDEIIYFSFYSFPLLHFIVLFLFLLLFYLQGSPLLLYFFSFDFRCSPIIIVIFFLYSFYLFGRCRFFYIMLCQTSKRMNEWKHVKQRSKTKTKKERKKNDRIHIGIVQKGIAEPNKKQYACSTVAETFTITWL